MKYKGLVLTTRDSPPHLCFSLFSSLRGLDHCQDAGLNRLGQPGPGGHDSGQVGVGLTGVVDQMGINQQTFMGGIWRFPLAGCRLTFIGWAVRLRSTEPKVTGSN